MIDFKRFIVFLALLCKLEARAILDVESYQISSIPESQTVKAEFKLRYVPTLPIKQLDPKHQPREASTRPPISTETVVVPKSLDAAPLKPIVTLKLPKASTDPVKDDLPFVISIPQIDVLRNERIEAVVKSMDRHIKNVLGKQDVHQLAQYYNPLWAGLSQPDILGYKIRESAEFRERFNLAVKELEFVLRHVNSDTPVVFGDKKIILKRSTPYSLTNLRLALNKMKYFGQHAGVSDWDDEVNAHANEVLVYVWNKVKENPEEFLPLLLEKLEDAGPTCIQGHTIRMLNTIHSYEKRFYSFPYEGNIALLP
jgi:hypothetical protein